MQQRSSVFNGYIRTYIHTYKHSIVTSWGRWIWQSISAQWGWLRGCRAPPPVARALSRRLGRGDPPRSAGRSGNTPHTPIAPSRHTKMRELVQKTSSKVLPTCAHIHTYIHTYTYIYISAYEYIQYILGIHTYIHIFINIWNEYIHIHINICI